jgi:hypothetical protein
MGLIINGHEIVPGLKIKFNTINSYDAENWIGIVSGIVDYSVAKAIGTDVDKYHAEVLKDTSGLDPIVEQQFIIISTADDGNPSRKVAFAVQWIDAATLAPVDITNSITVRIYDILETDIENALTVLAEAGFKAKYIG